MDKVRWTKNLTHIDSIFDIIVNPVYCGVLVNSSSLFFSMGDLFLQKIGREHFLRYIIDFVYFVDLTLCIFVDLTHFWLCVFCCFGIFSLCILLFWHIVHHSFSLWVIHFQKKLKDEILEINALKLFIDNSVYFNRFW